MSLSPNNVIWDYQYSVVVMLCGWESNHRFDTALAIHWAQAYERKMITPHTVHWNVEVLPDV